MSWPVPNGVDALAEESARVSDVVLGLPQDAFDLPTRCVAWNVKALLGHMYRDVDRIYEYRDLPAADPDADSVTYWTRYDPVDDAPDIAARAVRIAADHATGADLARAFDARWRGAVELARSMDPARPFKTFAPTLRLDEYVKTRVLEMTVHGLDLADALDREPWTTSSAADVTREILVTLLRRTPPPELGWDDLTFFDTATGRRAPADREQAILGEAADRLPLLA